MSNHGLPEGTDEHNSFIAPLTDEQGESDFRLEMISSEMEWLREQIRSLQQTLAHQDREQQAVEQELHATYSELEVMNREVHHLMTEAKQLTCNEAKEFAKALLAEGQTPSETLARLLSKIYGRTITTGELIQSQSPTSHSGALVVNERFTPPTKHSSRQEEWRAQYLALKSLTATFKAQFTQLQAQFKIFLEKSEINAFSSQEQAQQVKTHIDRSQALIAKSETLLRD